ncbi:MAG: bifunctional 23S rRNA (guanine(2069)-N(7))-methyltransferase RlmK/23S rRNA (guanine(2445)-N(2))-methyltransferase RlmL [Gammaproteobacteria bacterium]|nr:bifunctional 23S rRNA (guanine(2069)-N(7))-methyltransferase RlmK/23S rRNA (guanine(2445)-N(2))-methyltransferase RlmL [Gammaproteobacteria bacterium]
MKLFATAPEGTISLLETELIQLGASQIDVRPRGVAFEADLETTYRICLNSRIANRILMPVTRFKASSPEAIYDEIKMIRWEKHLHSSGTLAVDVTANRADVKHSHYAMLTVKDAVVDRFREQFDERPSIDTEFPDLRLNLLLQGERAQISIDLSGGSLHRRGYRIDGAGAPLKENLAAAILLHAGWDKIAAAGGSLYDPMCGSGTLLIEAALIAGDIAPGLYREHFGFLGWRRHDKELWQKVLDEAKERRREGLAKIPPISGSDANSDAIDAARHNIESVRLDDQITVEVKRVGDDLSPPATAKGLLIANPPYGERMGKTDELHPLYADLGAMAREHYKGWDFALFTGNPDLASETELVDHQPLDLKNGPIACKLFRYHILDGAAAKAEGPFANRLRKNIKHLKKWANREAISCYRIYDADLPDYAFAIDLYQGVDIEGEEQSWIHLQEYAPPATIDSRTAQQRLQSAIAQLAIIMELPSDHIFYKVRRRQRGESQYERQAKTGVFYKVIEGQCQFWVNFSDYLDTGLFLDHRNTRIWIANNSKGKDFLNLFGYTGSATIHAAVGGAKSTTTLDLSNTYLDWAQRNLELNHLERGDHKFIHTDTARLLQKQIHESAPKKYDLIFMDPPTFSNSKSTDERFDIQRDHWKLINDAMKLLQEDGLLIFSTNFRKFKLDEKLITKFDFKEITRSSIPEDFRQKGKIHRCWEVRHHPV